MRRTFSWYERFSFSKSARELILVVNGGAAGSEGDDGWGFPISELE